MYSWLPAVLHAMGSDKPDTVLADVALRLLDIGMQMGVSRPQLLGMLGIDDAHARNPLARLPLSAMTKLALMVEQRSGNPMAGLQIASQLSPRSFSDLGYPILYATDVATALRLFCELQPLYQNVLSPNFTIGDGASAWLTFDLVRADPNEAAPLSEWVVSAHLGIAGKVAGHQLPVREIGFSHAPRRGTDLYEQHFGCPVKFHQPNSYAIFDKAFALAPVPSANPNLVRIGVAAHDIVGQWLAESKQTLADAYLFCLLQLDRRPVSLERMALAFGYSERTLRRTLIQEGLPFRDLIDLARRVNFKLYQLEGQLSLSKIALRLGYSELSALSRAQRRWAEKA
jgi:AraC-like DNA-binding protein